MSADQDLETFTEWLKDTAAEPEAPETVEEPAVRVDLDLGNADVTGIAVGNAPAADQAAWLQWLGGS